MNSAHSETAVNLDWTQTPDHAKATLNILEDFAEDKARMEETQHAISNILEDFSGEKDRLQETQSATLNLLDDFDAERSKAEDISRELRESVELLRLAKDAAEESNHQLETFSYSVAHDLRAPLRHIGGFSKLLVEEFRLNLDPTAQRYLDRIQSGTQKMGLLVDELLNLAQVGRHTLNRQPTELNSMVAEVIGMLQPEMKERQVEWIIADLPMVDCDAVLVKQVFQNLLANALKFTRPRTAIVESAWARTPAPTRAVIEVSYTERDGQTIFMVRDNGIGFDMKYVDKLFGVFQRLHRPEEFEGTGIGLATVQNIVQKHGGRVWAEGEINQGASFYFTLDRARQAAKTMGAKAGGQL